MPPRRGDKPLTYMGIGLDVHVAARVDRLRACAGKSRSELIGQIVKGDETLAGLERRYVHEIGRFGALAQRAGQGWEDYVRHYAEKYAKLTYPPSVADLEENERKAHL